MKYSSKSNNFIATLIALLLIAAGFALGFAHRHLEATETKGKAKTASAEVAAPAKTWTGLTV